MTAAPPIADRQAIARTESGRPGTIDAPQISAIAVVASDTVEAQAAMRRLAARYPTVSPARASAIVALGGDGFLLRTLKQFMSSGKPVYGMNRGSVGFLLNDYREDDLLERLQSAVISVIHPLEMTAVDRTGASHQARAINEVSLLRQTVQAAKLKILIDGKERLNELICDGVLIATPAGSTAYNLSAHGPIIPINAPLLALTPISAFRPRRWRGALLPDHVEVRIDVHSPDERPVSASADQTEIRDVRAVTIREDRQIQGQLMFDADHSWDERILAEQFLY